MDPSRTVTKEETLKNRDLNLDRDALQRLEILRAENAEFENHGSNQFASYGAGSSELVSNPVSTEMAVAQLGALTGIIPTSAIFLKMIFDGPGRSDPGAAVALTLVILLSISLTATAGYYSGKLTGRILKDLEAKPWIVMLLALPFLGTTWGLLSGAAGGFVLFGIGALFGGAIGAVTGAAVLTFFGILHRSAKEGDVIEKSKLLPISIGLSSIVAALILGL